MPTRFPHPSNVYRVFLSKDWMAHLCLQPGLRCPATTKVNRASVETDPQAAAANALKSLDLIRKVQRGNNRDGNWAGRGATEKLGAPDASAYDPDSPVPWDKVTGVTKLGFSWEAADVKKFSGVDQLAARLRKLFDQPQVSHIEKVVQESTLCRHLPHHALASPTAHSLSPQCTADSTFVQIMVANADCEVRTFVVNGRPVKHARRFTKFDQPHDDAGGKFSVFDRCGRAEALERWFDNDDKALKVGFVLSCVVCSSVSLASALKNTSRASMT